MKTKIIALMLGFMPLTTPAKSPSPKESQVQNNFRQRKVPKSPRHKNHFLSKNALTTLWNIMTSFKDKLSMESAIQSKREIVGALLPQINAFSGLNYNIQKTTIAMPNFVNSMMPAAMRGRTPPNT